jgi:hypothetical protein
MPQTLTGPLPLDDIVTCQHCGRLMGPGRAAWRLSRLPLDVSWLHCGCLAAWVQAQPMEEVLHG